MTSHFKAARGAKRCSHRHRSAYAASRCIELGVQRPGVVERDDGAERVVQRASGCCVTFGNAHLLPTGGTSIPMGGDRRCKWCPSTLERMREVSE